MPREVNVIEQLLWKFSISQKPDEAEHVRTVCFRLFISAYTRELGNEARCMTKVSCIEVQLDSFLLVPMASQDVHRT